MAKILLKRGTRAQIDAAAAAGALTAGEPYLVADEGRLSVATAVDAHHCMARQDEIARTVKYSFVGALTAGAGKSRWYPDRPVTLLSAYLSAGTAPSSGAAAVDILKNGVSIGAQPTLPPGGNLSAAVPLSAGLNVTDYLTIDVLSANGAADALLTIVYQ